MSVELITGYSGEPHISSADDGARNIGTFGAGKYVLPTGTELSCTIQGANTAVIGAGDVLFEGRHVRITGTNEVSLDNGAQGINRNDIICLYYERDQSTTVETVTLVVLKGTGTAGTPVDPTIPNGSIAAGANEAYMALWRIPISGITPGTPVKLYGDVLPDMHDLATRTLPADQVPNISASKITSGTLAIARGGTGASTFNPHAVLIGPSSGSSAAAPTKRALVAADLPSSITSSTSGNAATSTSATKLATARSLYVALGSTYDSSNPVTFDGSANKALPVSGTLTAARGGTGQTSLQATRNAMGLGNTTGALPVANGGTGATTAAAARNALGLGNTTGALPIANGGTGLTSSPSLLVNLESTSAANVMTASPRPGITGELPIAHGGTGATTAAQARTNLGISLANLGAMAEPAVLYNSASGTNSSITLSTLGNYRRLKIYACANGTLGSGDCGSVDVYREGSSWGASPIANPSIVVGHGIDSTHSQLSIGSITVGSTAITPGMRYYTNFTNGASTEVGRDSKLYIYRIEAWA